MFRHLTFCFEIIYPENRIVLDYGNDEKLVLLGTFDKNGKETDWKYGHNGDLMWLKNTMVLRTSKNLNLW
jgi:hypothetical protein